MSCPSSFPPLGSPRWTISAARNWRALISVALLSSCTPPPVAPLPSDPIEPAPVVEHRELSEHIPSAGLRWLVHLKPKELLADPQLTKDWSPVFQADRVKAFTTTSGVRVEEVENAWIAGYDLGTLYLFDAKSTGHSAEKAFRDRALTTSELESDYQNLTHVTGMIEQTPNALIHIHDHLVAIAVGDIRLAKIVRAYAEGRLKKSPPALRNAYLSPVAHFEEASPIRAFLLGPFEDATDAAVSGFIGGAMAVEFHGDSLDISAQALGVWPAESLSERLTQWTDQVLSTREFRALGWGFPRKSPEVRCAPQNQELITCRAEGEWSSAEIASALHRITAGSMSDIVSTSPSGWGSEATTQAPSQGETTSSDRSENAESKNAESKNAESKNAESKNEVSSSEAVDHKSTAPQPTDESSP